MTAGVPMFLPDRCDFCGDCLAGCPVLGVPEAISGGLVRRLAAGEYVREVLDRCTSCMSCDALCEKGARPYGLLLEHYHRRYLETGIPAVFRNAMPQRPGPNLWNASERRLSQGEKRNLALWSRAPAGEEVIFLGCNQRLTPYIADTSLFGDVEVFTDPRECCGELYYRLGILEVARQKATSLASRFSALGIRKVIAFCPACHNTMTNLMPKTLGVRFDVEVTGLFDWLAGRVERGQIKLSRSVLGTVTVQDPCHASGLEASTIGNVRHLLHLMGLEVAEMENAGITAECCGLGASLARYRVTDVMRAGLKRIRQSRGSGADLTCTWCNGCYTVMNMFRLVYPAAPPVYHLLELLQTATGERPERRVPARSFQLLLSALEASARDGFRFGRVTV